MNSSAPVKFLRETEVSRLGILVARGVTQYNRNYDVCM